MDTSSSQSEPVASQDGNSASGLADSARLTKFFSKLLSEALLLKGDKVLLVADREKMSATICCGKDVLKVVNLRPVWFDAADDWLKARVLPWAEPVQPKLSITETPTELPQSKILVRLTSCALVCNVQRWAALKGERRLTISLGEQIPLDALREALGAVGVSEIQLRKLLGATSGIVVVAAPEEEQLAKTLSLLLALTPAISLPQSALAQPGSELVNAAQHELVLVGVKSEDALLGALKLREMGLDLANLPLVGIIGLGLVRRVCTKCARDTAVDRSRLKSLPSELHPDQDLQYKVGRGCQSCNQSGYSGWVGVQNVFLWDQGARDLMVRHADGRELVEHLYKAGGRSLLEDGLEKVVRGLTTFEELFKVSKLWPDFYLKHQQSVRRKAGGKSETTIEVKDDFFGAPGAIQPSGGVAARAAFYRSSGDAEGDNAPLFSVGLTKTREKPLIMVVEDDADQRAILEMVLKSSKYDVCLAFDGQDALNKLAKDVPDLIITDLMMPNMDGRELVKHLKGHPLLKKVPVVVLTVLSDTDKEYDLLDLGADDYCEKTVQRKILLKRLEKVLKRSGR